MDTTLDLSALLPDVSVLPFYSHKDEWMAIVNFKTVEDMMAYLNGTREHDVFFVEKKLLDAWVAEEGCDIGTMVIHLQTRLPKWLALQRQATGLDVGKGIETRFQNSNITFEIGHLQQGFFVHFPKDRTKYKLSRLQN